MQDVVNGQPRSRAWPRKRPTPQSKEQRDNMAKFKQVQLAANFITPEVMLYFNKATQGSPLLPRDVLTMMLYNRWMAFDIEGLGWRWPLPAYQDVSQALDVLGQGIGETLIRTPEGWKAQTDPNAGAGAWNTHLATIIPPSPTYASGQFPGQFNSVLYNPKGWWTPAKWGFTPDAPGLYLMAAVISSTGTRATRVWSGINGVRQFEATTNTSASRSPIMGLAPAIVTGPDQTIQCIVSMSSAGGYETLSEDNWLMVCGPIG